MLENVRKWVLDQGYPLEMRTALAFRKGGFEVHQSEIHYDETAGKTREIDVVAIDCNYRGLPGLPSLWNVSHPRNLASSSARIRPQQV